MSKKNINSVEKFFDETAKEFTDLYLTLPAFKERYWIFKRYITEILRKMEGTNCFCLDIGCGDGILSRIVAKLRCRVLGIDMSLNMINLAKEKAKRENLSNLTSYIQSSFPANFKSMDRSFNLIIASSVLEYINDVSSVLIEINRLLKQNGFFLVSLPNYWSLYWSLYRFSKRHLKNYFFRGNLQLNYQRHQFRVSQFRDIASKCGFKYIRHEYFSVNNYVYRVIPRYRNFILGNLFLMVLQKDPESPH